LPALFSIRSGSARSVSHAFAACCQPWASKRRLVLSFASARSKPPAAADARAYASTVCSAATVAACLTIGAAAAHASADTGGWTLAR